MIIGRACVEITGKKWESSAWPSVLFSLTVWHESFESIPLLRHKFNLIWNSCCFVFTVLKLNWRTWLLLCGKYFLLEELYALSVSKSCGRRSVLRSPGYHILHSTSIFPFHLFLLLSRLFPAISFSVELCVTSQTLSTNLPFTSLAYTQPLLAGSNSAQ